MKIYLHARADADAGQAGQTTGLFGHYMAKEAC